MESKFKQKRFRVVCYIRVDTDDNDLLTLEEAIKNREQGTFMQPENIYKIEEADHGSWG